MVVNPSQMNLYDGPASLRMDKTARETLQVSGIVMMERAAAAALAELVQHFPDARSVSIWCGKGNNAGDAYFLAAEASKLGLDACVYSVVPVRDLSGDAATAANTAIQAGIQPKEVTLDNPLPAIEADVIVDGLLGTGLKNAPRPLFQSAIDHLNATDTPVLSLDIPSGLGAAAGEALGSVIRATITVTFITYKTGLLTGAGPAYCGRVVHKSLGLPESAYCEPSAQRIVWQPRLMPVVDVSAYKHTQGNVLIVGGGQGMPGAVSMTAQAALRCGAGLVTVATLPSHTAAITSRIPEVMIQDVADKEALAQKLVDADLLVLGPGLGRDSWARELVHWLHDQTSASLPVLIDADGLHWLAELREWPAQRLYLTSHAAEAARLLGASVAEVQQQRLLAAHHIAQRYNAQVVLKGPGSVVATGAGCGICTHGNAGMATAGMGDVLSGVIAGILAPLWREIAHLTSAFVDDVKLVQLFCQAVALHSAAADRAAERLGRRSLMATDVIAAIPELLKECDD